MSLVTDFLSDRDWRNLLREIHSGQVIPVIGPDLVTIAADDQASDAPPIPLHRYLAPQLAAALMVTAEQVQSQSTDILQNFYLRSFDNLSSAVRTYVEDRMVTIGGHRNPVARENAMSELAAQGVVNPSDAIDQLIQGRLLSSEERGGVQRLEITHDVLAPLVVHSRDQRRVRERAEKAEREQEESRRQRRNLQRIAGAMIALTLLALASTAFAIYSAYQANDQKRIAENARTDAEIARKAAEIAEGRANRQEEKAKKSLDDLTEQSKQAATVLFDYGQSEFAAGRVRSASEKLERAWRLRSEADPSKRDCAIWLVTRKSFSNRSFAQLHHSEAVNFVAFSPDGTRVVTVSLDNTARLWDASSGAPIGEPMRHEHYVDSVAFSPDGMRVATDRGTRLLASGIPTSYCRIRWRRFSIDLQGNMTQRFLAILNTKLQWKLYG